MPGRPGGTDNPGTGWEVSVQLEQSTSGRPRADVAAVTGRGLTMAGFGAAPTCSEVIRRDAQRTEWSDRVRFAYLFTYLFIHSFFLFGRTMQLVGS